MGFPNKNLYTILFRKKPSALSIDIERDAPNMASCTYMYGIIHKELLVNARLIAFALKMVTG